MEWQRPNNYGMAISSSDGHLFDSRQANDDLYYRDLGERVTFSKNMSYELFPGPPFSLFPRAEKKLKTGPKKRVIPSGISFLGVVSIA
jgi:hypothetical protein